MNTTDLKLEITSRLDDMIMHQTKNGVCFGSMYYGPLTQTFCELFGESVFVCKTFVYDGHMFTIIQEDTEGTQLIIYYKGEIVFVDND